MKQFGKEIIFCIILGILIPYIMFLFAKKDAKEENTIPLEIAVEDTKDEQIETIDVLHNNVIHTMILEDYIVAVVLCEMPASFELEALKAQAVVARTYALRRKLIDRKHENADVCTNPDCCQGYCDIDEYISKGGTKEAVTKVEIAVLETRSIIVVYNGELIDATYFSCSGGMTEDAAAVWGTDVPYLQATKSPGEEKATSYTDIVTFSTTEFLEKLQLTSQSRPESWIEEIQYTAGGGVDALRICGKIYKGTDLRRILGLRSTLFTITLTGDMVQITTKGFGHRVGMSQYGADAMALQGKLYDEILTYYYKGTRVETIEALTH